MRPIVLSYHGIFHPRPTSCSRLDAHHSPNLASPCVDRRGGRAALRRSSGSARALYYWRSQVDGQRICAQTSPGVGWTRDSDAFEGPGCQPRRRVIVVPMR